MIVTLTFGSKWREALLLGSKAVMIVTSGSRFVIRICQYAVFRRDEQISVHFCFMLEHLKIGQSDRKDQNLLVWRAVYFADGLHDLLANGPFHLPIIYYDDVFALTELLLLFRP